MSAMTLDERRLENRLLAVPMGPPSSSPLAGHIAAHGSLAIPNHDDAIWNAGISRAVHDPQGLTRRGGAGFPRGQMGGAATQRSAAGRGGQRHRGRAGQRTRTGCS